jgi:hypothetical protein
MRVLVIRCTISLEDSNYQLLLFDEITWKSYTISFDSVLPVGTFASFPLELLTEVKHAS